MRFLLVVLIAVALLIAALAMRAPASLIDARIKEVLSGNVRLSDTTGTIWNGSGFLTVLPGGARIPVTWKIDALPLLHGELTGTLGTGNSGDTAGSFVLDRQHFTLRNLSVSVPMDALLRTAGVPQPFAAAGGIVDLHIDTLTRKDDSVDGTLNATWTNASLPGPRAGSKVALGDVRIDAAGPGPDLPGTVANTGGDVDIKGNITLSANGARGDAVIAPRPGIDADQANAISAALSAVGQPAGAGGFRLVWSTGKQ